MRITRSKWFLPLFSVALGLLLSAAQWVGGNPGSGLVSLGRRSSRGHARTAPLRQAREPHGARGRLPSSPGLPGADYVAELEPGTMGDSDGLRPGVNTELGQDVLDVRAERPLCDP
jgi:hypothetical protein